MRRRRLRGLHGGPRGPRRRREDDLARHQQLHRAPAHVRRPGDRHRGRPGRGETLHPVQAAHGGAVRLAVRLLHAGFRDVPVRGVLPPRLPPPARLSDQLSGNLCRCTGYRPIRDAALDALAERDARDAAADRVRRAPARAATAAVRHWTTRRRADGSSGRHPSRASWPRWRQIPARAWWRAPRRSAWTSPRSSPLSRSSFPRKACPSSRGSARTTGCVAHRRGGHPHRYRGNGGARVPVPGKDAARVRLPRHPQQGDHGREPRHRVPDRRQRPGAPHPGCVARPRLAERRTHGCAGRVFPRLPEDGPGAGRDHQGDRPARFCPTPRGPRAAGGFPEGVQAPGAGHQHRRRRPSALDLDADGVVRAARLRLRRRGPDAAAGAGSRGGARGQATRRRPGAGGGAAARRVPAHR